MHDKFAETTATHKETTLGIATPLVTKPSLRKSIHL